MNSNSTNSRHMKKRSKWWIVLWTFLSLIVVSCVLGVMLLVPTTNNMIRSIIHTDTPTDRIVKQKMVDKVNHMEIPSEYANKIANSGATDGNSADASANQVKAKESIKQYLNKVPMSKIQKAATDQKTAESLVKSFKGVDDAQAQEIVSQIYNNPDYNDVRQELAKGDYLKAYNSYRNAQENSNASNTSQQ